MKILTHFLDCFQLPKIFQFPPLCAGGVLAVPGDNVPLKVWNETIMKQMTECNDRFFTGFIELKESLYVSSINNDAINISTLFSWKKGMW